jgi:adenosine kinase
MRIVVSGSIAFDYIMFFPGFFKDHILPEQISSLSVSFLVDSLKKQRGGCAPNIAYNCGLLGERATVMGTVGQDFGDYRAWLDEHGVDTSAIRAIPDDFTSSFFVSTDRSNNQIASFYTGAMSKARQLSFRDLPYREIAVAIISPNDPEAMCRNVKECQALNVPYIYDPSQQIVRLTAEDLLEGGRGARILIVNDYEFEMLKKKTGLSQQQMERIAPTVIVTRGDKGSTIFVGEESFEIPVVSPRRVADPTGVGDAYRAGIIKGFLHGYDWQTTGRMATLAATYCLEEYGTQNHTYTYADFLARYREVFDSAPRPS